MGRICPCASGNQRSRKRCVMAILLSGIGYASPSHDVQALTQDQAQIGLDFGAAHESH